MAGFIKEWRQFTSPKIQDVEGNQLYDHIFLCYKRTPACKMIGYTESEWVDEITPEVSFSGVST